MIGTTHPAHALLALFAAEPSPEAEPDPLAAALYAAGRLAGRPQAGAVAHAVQQVAVAVAAGVARVVGSGELPFDLARSLPALLRDLDVAVALGRPAQAAAVRLEAALDSAGDALARGTPATLCALLQAQHDTLHIQRLERGRPGRLGAAAANPTREAALALLATIGRAAAARPGETTRLDALRGIGCMTLVLAVHLGGPEAPVEVARAVREVVAWLASMVPPAGGEASVAAIDELAGRLAGLVQILDAKAGSTLGCKAALLAICHDLRALTALAHAPSSFAAVDP